MNRFEHSSPGVGRKIAVYLPLIASVGLLIVFIQGIQAVNDTTLSKQQESLETALQRGVSQCYAVEGVYPPSLAYLKEHYGLIYDEDTFLVDYDYYGGNLLPEIHVLRKKGVKE